MGAVGSKEGRDGERVESGFAFLRQVRPTHLDPAFDCAFGIHRALTYLPTFSVIKKNHCGLYLKEKKILNDVVYAFPGLIPLLIYCLFITFLTSKCGLERPCKNSQRVLQTEKLAC